MNSATFSVVIGSGGPSLRRLSNADAVTVASLAAGVPFGGESFDIGRLEQVDSRFRERVRQFAALRQGADAAFRRVENFRGWAMS